MAIGAAQLRRPRPLRRRGVRLILPGCNLADGLALVERLRAATPDGESCSAGIAEWDGEEQPEPLLGRADAALYQAKRAGRDQVVTAPAR